LILAAASKFGMASPEFNMLRQVWAQRILQNTMKPSDKLANISEEVQRIMFPGISLNQMQTLAREMDFLLKTKSGSRMGAGPSMAATSKVEHPWSSVVGKGGEYLPKLPFADAVGRFVIGSYLKLVTTLFNYLPAMRWLEKGLNGNAEAKAATRQELQRLMQKGGIIGAAVGESAFQTPNEQLIQNPPNARQAPNGKLQ